MDGDGLEFKPRDPVIWYRKGYTNHVVKYNAVFLEYVTAERAIILVTHWYGNKKKTVYVKNLRKVN